MRALRLSVRQWVGYTGFVLVALIVVGALAWRGDILRSWLDPRVPFPAYDPPPAPDYARRSAWALLEARGPGGGETPVFFLHPTAYDGGQHWLAPIDDAQALAYLRRVILPNHAAPFARSGPVSAPLYRHASLYTRLTLREDAREARAYAYRDAAAAFEVWLRRHPDGPLVIAGVEQGAELAARLLRERVWPDAGLRRRLVAAYLLDAVVPDNAPGLPPPCRTQSETGCTVAFTAVVEGEDGDVRRRLGRALFWNARGRLVEVGGARPICVNPVTGSAGEIAIPHRRHHGATNATGLEWGVRPALIAHEIATECRAGVLRFSAPRQESFRPAGSWADRRKVQPYNLFYGDIEVDLEARTAAFQSSADRSARQSNSASST